MTGRRPRLAATLLALLAAGAPARAASLADQLNAAMVRSGVRVTRGAEEDLTFVARLVRHASRTGDYPITSTSPDYVYRYDPSTATFERMPASLGSVLLERADTVGRGVFELGASAFYADYDRLNGNDLDSRVVSQFTLRLPRETSDAIIRLRFEDFSLRTFGTFFSATWGVRDDLDVNVLVPIMNTRLDVRGARRAFVASVGAVGPPLQRIRIDEDRTGIGDVLLRGKWRLPDTPLVDLALALTTRLPTGDIEEFQGLGDTVVTPTLIASRHVFGHDFHANAGVDFDADAVERSRLRYGVGAALRLHDRVTLLLDVLGSSSFRDQSFRETFRIGTGRGTLVQVPFTIPQSDIVDGAVGVKLKLWESGTLFLTAIVPLTSDGLRPDVVPGGGLQVTF